MLTPSVVRNGGAITKLHIAGLYRSHLLSKILNMGVEFMQGHPENIAHLGTDKIVI